MTTKSSLNTARAYSFDRKYQSVTYFIDEFFPISHASLACVFIYYKYTIAKLIHSTDMTLY